MVAALRSLHPILALGTLLVVGTLSKLHELLVVIVKDIINSILCTRHSGMIVTFAFQTVVLFAAWTTVFSYISLKFEYSLTACRRAPRIGGVIFLDVFIEGESLVFLPDCFFRKGVNISGIQFFAAALHRTPNIEIANLDLCLEKFAETSRMKDVTTVQKSYGRRVYINKADLTLPTFPFFLTNGSLIFPFAFFRHVPYWLLFLLDFSFSLTVTATVPFLFLHFPLGLQFLLLQADICLQDLNDSQNILNVYLLI